MRILIAILVAYTILYLDDKIDELRNEIDILKVKIEQLQEKENEHRQI